MQAAYASPSALRGGDHVYALTRSDAELAWLARAFVGHAERAGARTVYLSEASPEDVARLGLPDPARPDGLVVLEGASILAPERTFDRETFVGALEAAVESSLEDGFAGAHVFVEVGWSLRGIRGVEDRWEVEAVAHDLDLIHRGDTVLLCQYRGDRFEPEALEMARRSHPVIVPTPSRDHPPSAAARVTQVGDVFRVSGELDRGTAALLVTACRGRAGSVTMDLTETTFFDVGAYRALISVARACRRVTLVHAPAIVRRVVSHLRAEAGIDIEVDGETVSVGAG